MLKKISLKTVCKGDVGNSVQPKPNTVIITRAVRHYNEHLLDIYNLPYNKCDKKTYKTQEY